MEPDYLHLLNKEQREAVLHEDGPLLILAGAGSGKTRVITTRIAYLISQKGFFPSSILAVTFTNKAAKEMRERVNSLVKDDSMGVFIKTFHSFGSYFLREYGHLIGLPRYFSIYDEDDAISLLSRVHSGLPKAHIKQIVKKIFRVKDYALSPDDDLSEFSRDPEFRHYYETYTRLLREAGSVDLGDLIFLPWQILTRFPEVKKHVHDRFKAILVDEYQDTNRTQYKLLQELVGSHTWLCVVGDDDQSIYKFRGAELENILTFQDNFAGTKIIRLEQNYRSTGPILSIASAVVSHNKGRLGKNLWTETQEGELARLYFLQDQNAEAELCANLIKEGFPGTSAILYRTNAQSRLFETVFRQRGIRYRLVGSVSFYSREEIKDALAYLSLFLNEKDEVSFVRILNKPTRGIGPKRRNTLIEATQFLESHSFVEASVQAIPQTKGKGKEGLLQFTRIFEYSQELEGSENLGDFVREVLSRSGLYEYYREEDKANLTQKFENLSELINAATPYPNTKEGLAEFLELVELDRSFADQWDEQTAEVTLITMHNTKGLEFDRVIITGMEDELFPRERFDALEIEEERRLFYVAITRARKELLLTSCRRRMLYGRTSHAQPSRFLDEIPSELCIVEGVEMEANWLIGHRVMHHDYGIGTIVKRWYSEGLFTIIVRFDTGQKARFIPRFTPLERISDEY